MVNPKGPQNELGKKRGKKTGNYFDENKIIECLKVRDELSQRLEDYREERDRPNIANIGIRKRERQALDGSQRE